MAALLTTSKSNGAKWYAWIFAISTIFACGVLLPGVQSNSIGNAVEAAFGSGDMIETAIGTFSFAKIFTGTVVCVILAFIIFGGVKRIANFTQIVVPFMALAYIITAFVIILLNIGEIPRIIGMILGDAFTPMAGVGAAIGWGVKRGVYSNEAGQGTGPHAAAAASVDHPAQQGLVQSFSIYIDTLLVCSATAFMILITGRTTYTVRLKVHSLCKTYPLTLVRMVQYSRKWRLKVLYLELVNRSSLLHCSSSHSPLSWLTTTSQKQTLPTFAVPLK